MAKQARTTKEIYTLLAIFFLALLISGIRPHDYFTWFLEVLPAVLGLVILVFTYKRFRFTNFIYVLVLIHSIILMIGGHYTYAEVPFFDWVRHVLGLARNHYDRVGHFSQGFFPAMIAREVLIRNSVVRKKKWLGVFIVSICLAASAIYEFFEWWTALATGEAAAAFLGTQGDPWDTQWDMFLAFIGSITALLLLSKIHDKYLKTLRTK